MNSARRQFLRFAAVTAIAPALSPVAWAQAYPARPVRILVGNAAGSTQDTFARLIGQWLSDRLGQPFIIENRPGGGGNVATEAAIRAEADGHTLLFLAPVHAINATLYPKFDFVHEIAPVANIVHQTQIMLLNPSVPATTVPAFIAYAKANPGKINMASAGNGTSPHMAGELFKMMTGIDMVHVPYRGGGGAAMTDLIANHVQVMFLTPALSMEHVRTGRLRALAVTTATRFDALPDVPTVAETVPGYESGSWFGLGAPKATPPAIVERLNAEINAGLADPKIKARLDDLGGGIAAMSPAEFAKLIADDIERWAKVIKFAGIKLD
jgi:tripartite-type tricarboxylate transporter receptor subunit TctC